MSYFINITWLLEHLEDSAVVVVDCRFVMGNPQAGREAFHVEHIPCAVYMDLEQDLSAPKAVHGGRHPLPHVMDLAERLSKAGISTGKTVVAYDDQGGAMASRLWWLLRYMGHSAVYVLDGSFAMWKLAGYPVTSVVRERSPEVFIPRVQDDMVVSMEEVRDHLGKAERVLIDSREEPRYKGLVEPIDSISGHIPGAVNYFWKEGLNPEGQSKETGMWNGGMWKTAEEQKGRFEKLDASKEIVVYCGSGITACPNILALQEAGFTKVKLYAGSWSDWVSYPENPVETGEE